MPPSRRRGASPDRTTLDELAQAPPRGRLQKAPAVDPVLGAVGTAAAGQPDGVDPTVRPGQRGRGQTAGSRGEKAVTAPVAKTKVGFYQDATDIGRARAAYDWTRPYEGHRSFSDFIAAAIMREVNRLEAKYHDGQPWPALAPGQLPTGKPLGA